ncbi:MAG: TRAP transporter permease DctM/Q [Deltaproteobacteria bacterium]|nr:MAG: TRAP transporter permease DctM/Q [Deltaproteobacteria bacterium]
MDWTIYIVSAAFFILLIIGVPVGFALTGIAMLGTIFAWGFCGLYQVVSTTYSDATSFILIAIPLFILMANFLERSGLADDLYEIIYRWSGGLKGGLAIGTVVICAIFGAMSGVSSVATVTMGMIALPAMFKRDYNKDMVLGSIMAGGALGILIPPSIIMIIYAGIAEVSVGKLFMAGVMPGILLSLLFIGYIGVRCFLNPQMGPPVSEKYTLKEKLQSLKGIILPILLVLFVLGSIYKGIATPTEAAGIGAFGALLCMIIYKRFSFENLKSALLSTIKLNAMVMWIIIGAACFTHYLAFIGVQDVVQEMVLGLNISNWWILIFIQALFFFCGMILEPAAIITLLGPILVPIVHTLGFDLLWFGVLFVINMTMGYLTPPFGFNLFILKGVAPRSVTMGDLYRSVIPFCILQAIGLALVMLFPEIALWLPNHMAN